ncbi:MAG TPA: GAF domain-containing protein, partial [Myxococcales bacterium]
MPFVGKMRLALVGPRAEACGAALAQQGIELSSEAGAAALIDLDLDDATITRARAGFSPVLGLAHDGKAPDSRVDAMVRSAEDVPQLLALLAKASADARRKDEDLEALVDVTAALARGGDLEDLLGHVVRRIAGRLTVERCSIVLVNPDGSGSVMVASDDTSARGKLISLAHYPEIRHVLLTGAPLAVSDAESHALLDPVRAHLSGQNITALAVVPMICEGQTVGVLFVRSRTRGGFEPREVALLTSVASAA